MHVHKPADAMLLLGYQSRGGQSSLTVTVGYCCGADGTRLSEPEAWKTLTALFTDEPFDLAQKKSRGGFGVAGAAKAPQGRPVTGLTVRAGVGSLEKSVLVLGDRYWSRGVAGWQPSAPQPYTDMPIGLARAYGAKGWAANPHGRGHCAQADQADGVALPNVEDPSAPVLRPGDVPRPASLGVLAQGAPEQIRWLGTLDKRWQRARLPWLPDDTDPRWFDRFAQDQCQQGYWRGDESWFAENMHPDHPLQRGTLPGLRPRVLVRTDAAPERRVEVPLDLDTVWLLPNDERVLVLYRGEFATRREDAEDVLGLGIFTERMSEPPQTTQHWALMWQEAGETATPAQAQTLAAPEPGPEAAAKTAAAGKAVEEMGKAAAAHRATVARTLADTRASAIAETDQTMQRYGLGSLQAKMAQSDAPPNTLALPTPEWPKEPTAFKAAVRQYVADALAAGEAETREQWRAHGLDYDAALARSRARPPVVLDPADAVAKMKLPPDAKAALMERYQAFQIKMDALQLNAKKISKQAEALQAQEPPPLPLPDEAMPRGPRTVLDREALLDRHARHASAQWCELQGLDLSGVDLAGLDLSSSLLRGCVLRGANLEGVDFTDCQLEDCDLGDAQLSRARFPRALLKGCQAAGAKLPGADFTQARMEKCVFTQADLSTTRWATAQAKECDFDKAVLRQAQGQDARFTACRFAAIDAASSRFPKAMFSKCVLEDATLDGADLQGATLMTCQAAGSRYDGASMAQLRTLKGTDLSRANLNRALLDKASLQDTNLGKATLRETRMDRGFLKNCDLSGTDAWHLVARVCDFTGSRITQASWRGANLMQARLRQVVLQDVDLTGANLHAADTRTATAQGVQLDQALLTRCRLLEDYGRE